MPISAGTLALLMSKGLVGDDLVEVVRAIDADMGSGAPCQPAETAADRRRAWDRERKQIAAAEKRNSGGKSGGIPPEKAPSLFPQRDNNQTPNTPPKSSLRSESAKSIADGFNDFWSVVPRKTGKDAAEKAYRRIVASKRAMPAEILIGAIRWRDESCGDDPQFVPHPATWLNRGGWDDEPRRPGARAGPRLAAINRPTHASVLRKDLNLDQQFASPPTFFDPDPHDARPSAFRRAFDHAQQPDPQAERRSLLGAERRAERERARVDDG